MIDLGLDVEFGQGYGQATRPCDAEGSDEEGESEARRERGVRERARTRSREGPGAPVVALHCRPPMQPPVSHWS